MAKPKFRVSKPYAGRRKNKNLRHKFKRVETEFGGIGQISENYLSLNAKKFQAFGIIEEILSKQSRSTDSCLQDSSDWFFLFRNRARKVLFRNFIVPTAKLLDT